MKAWLNRVWKWWTEINKCEVMIVNYNTITNQLECLSWTGKRIADFCGEFTEKMWTDIKAYSLINSEVPTKIYIWGGYERKHLAYCEPIEAYLESPDLLQTGQGFDYHSGLRHSKEEAEGMIKCPTCKKTWIHPN